MLPWPEYYSSLRKRMDFCFIPRAKRVQGCCLYLRALLPLHCFNILALRRHGLRLFMFSMLFPITSVMFSITILRFIWLSWSTDITIFKHQILPTVTSRLFQIFITTLPKSANFPVPFFHRLPHIYSSCLQYYCTSGALDFEWYAKFLLYSGTVFPHHPSTVHIDLMNILDQCPKRSNKCRSIRQCMLNTISGRLWNLLASGDKTGLEKMIVHSETQILMIEIKV